VAELAVEYFFLVLICCCGVLQFVAARWNLSGISFFKKTTFGYLFAALAIGGAFSWFFTIENRAQPGLEGTQVFALFIAGSLASFLVTASISAVIKRKLHLSMEQRNPEEEPGLDYLRRMTYFQAIARHFRKKGRG
jgi:hypothetical protein